MCTMRFFIIAIKNRFLVLTVEKDVYYVDFFSVEDRFINNKKNKYMYMYLHTAESRRKQLFLFITLFENRSICCSKLNQVETRRS